MARHRPAAAPLVRSVVWEAYPASRRLATAPGGLETGPPDAGQPVGSHVVTAVLIAARDHGTVA
jgi:hypothetical protein